MSNAIIEFLRNIIPNDNIIIMLISMIPIIELRGAIPFAIGINFSPIKALFLSFIGSSLVVPILLLFLKPVLNYLKKIKFVENFAKAIESAFVDKANKVIEKQKEKGNIVDGKLATKYKMLGVLGFVGIPLPLTGVWTGTAVAVFLDLKFIPSLIVVVLGNLLAGIIMTTLCFFFKSYVDTIIMVFLGIVVLILIAYVIKLIVKTIQMKNS